MRSGPDPGPSHGTGGHMAGDGLFDPLGVDRADPIRASRRLSPAVAVAVLAVVGGTVLVAVAWFRDNGDRGHPRAIAPIERVVAPPKPVAPPPPAAAPAAPATVASGQSMPGFPPPDDQEVEIQNGVRIIRPRRERPPAGALTLPAAPAPQIPKP